jgi:hypothetical protein
LSEIDPALYGLAGITAVLLVLFGLILAARRRADDEKGLTPCWEGFCTGKIGGFIGVGIPAIRISIYPEFFVMCFVFPKIIYSNEIVRVNISRKLLFYSVLQVQVRDGKSITFNTSRSCAERVHIKLLELKNSKGILEIS